MKQEEKAEREMEKEYEKEARKRITKNKCVFVYELNECRLPHCRCGANVRLGFDNDAFDEFWKLLQKNFKIFGKKRGKKCLEH